MIDKSAQGISTVITGDCLRLSHVLIERQLKTVRLV
jgi:hypothetical protein